jgi:hypothetical protein
MTEELQPKPDPKPKRPKPKPKPVPKPVPAPEPPKRKRKRVRKPTVQGFKIDWSRIDWYAIGLGLLALITVAPYVLPMLKDVRITPVVSYDLGNVSNWFETVASDDPKADLPKYVDALRATASAEISDVSKIDEKLQEEVESRLGRIGWLNWGLFNAEILKEIRKLRDDKKIDATVKSHQAFLLAVADELEKVGQ